MIRFKDVSKVYPGGTTAVDGLDLHIPEGEIVVLVGPSGCGKTTTLRLINRMIDPTAGTIEFDGEDVSTTSAHDLRRRIGYVIQSGGLFPHRTIADNIATVPKLLRWDRDRIRTRVAELLDLVGLPPSVAERYPHQLSGGQRQRVGVARALAVDPPVMLMDEPFGAVDPIVRTHLQDEFLRLQAEVRKTIVFVTHDIDEAIRVGDRIAIFAVGGVLAQYATPHELLSSPRNDFVRDFLGEDRALKQLALIPVSAIDPEPGPVVSPGTPLAEAARVADAHRADRVLVLDEQSRVVGTVSLEALEGRGTVEDVPWAAPPATVTADDTLRNALNAIVLGEHGVAVRVGADDSYEGVVDHATITAALT